MVDAGSEDIQANLQARRLADLLRRTTLPQVQKPIIKPRVTERARWVPSMSEPMYRARSPRRQLRFRRRGKYMRTRLKEPSTDRVVVRGHRQAFYQLRVAIEAGRQDLWQRYRAIPSKALKHMKTTLHEAVLRSQLRQLRHESGTAFVRAIHIFYQLQRLRHRRRRINMSLLQSIAELGFGRIKHFLATANERRARKVIHRLSPVIRAIMERSGHRGSPLQPLDLPEGVPLITQWRQLLQAAGLFKQTTTKEAPTMLQRAYEAFRGVFAARAEVPSYQRSPAMLAWRNRWRAQALRLEESEDALTAIEAAAKRLSSTKSLIDQAEQTGTSLLETIGSAPMALPIDFYIAAIWQLLTRSYVQPAPRRIDIVLDLLIGYRRRANVVADAGGLLLLHRLVADALGPVAHDIQGLSSTRWHQTLSLILSLFDPLANNSAGRLKLRERREIDSATLFSLLEIACGRQDYPVSKSLYLILQQRQTQALTLMPSTAFSWFFLEAATPEHVNRDSIFPYQLYETYRERGLSWPRQLRGPLLRVAASRYEIDRVRRMLLGLERDGRGGLTSDDALGMVQGILTRQDEQEGAQLFNLIERSKPSHALLAGMSKRLKQRPRLLPYEGYELYIDHLVRRGRTTEARQIMDLAQLPPGRRQLLEARCSNVQ